MTALQKHCLNTVFGGMVWAINSDGSLSWDSAANGRPMPSEAEYMTPEAIASFPPPVRTWTASEFLRRFTADERVAIIKAGKTREQIDDLYRLLIAANEVRSDSAELIAGLALLVHAGLLAAERRDQILGG